MTVRQGLSLLVGHMSATSEKRRKNNVLMRVGLIMSPLSLTDKRHRVEKLNEFNACRLVGLVAPTEDADADKRRPPSAADRPKKPENKSGEIKTRAKDRLSRGGADGLASIPHVVGSEIGR